MPIHRLQNGKWRLQVRRRGFASLDRVFESRNEAIAAEQDYLKELRSAPSGGSLLLVELWARYVTSQSFEAKALTTRRTEQCRLKPVLASLGKYSLAVLEQRPHLIYDYIDARLKVLSKRTQRTLSQSSVRLEVAALSSVVQWAQRRKLLLSNFTKSIQRPGQAKRKRRVSSLELGKLEGAIAARDDIGVYEAALFLTLLRRLGCRPGELCRVARADVLLQSKEVVFRDTKYKGEDRRVPIADGAFSYVKMAYGHAVQRYPESPYLFTSRSRATADPQPFKPYNYAHGIRRLRELDVIPENFYAHAMRREFVSRAIEAGLDYSTIRKITGHHSTQAIEIYDEGLAVAPEVRNRLNLHEQEFSKEILLGRLEALGASPETLAQAHAALNNEELLPFTTPLPDGTTEFHTTNAADKIVQAAWPKSARANGRSAKKRASK